eukprot:scaffold148752_cov40-Tisochrysis_lutea.AAC.1
MRGAAAARRGLARGSLTTLAGRDERARGREGGVGDTGRGGGKAEVAFLYHFYAESRVYYSTMYSSPLSCSSRGGWAAALLSVSRVSCTTMNKRSEK